MTGIIGFFFVISFFILLTVMFLLAYKLLLECKLLLLRVPKPKKRTVKKIVYHDDLDEK